MPRRSELSPTALEPAAAPLFLPQALQSKGAAETCTGYFWWMTDTDDRVRLDKWLWAARFYKTRSLAAEAIAGGKVQVNGDRVKRAKPVQIGDEVRIRQGPYEHQVLVRALSARRGPAADAVKLYEEKPESRAARDAMALQLKSLHVAFVPERGRPTKKDRREIEKLKRREP